MHKKMNITVVFLFFWFSFLETAQETKRSILSHIPKDKDGSLPATTPIPLPADATPKTVNSVPQQTPAPLIGKKLQENRKIEMPSLPTPPEKKPSVAPKEKTPEETPLPEKPKKPEAAPQKSDEEQKAFEKAKDEVIEEQKVTFYFEDATLQNLVKYMEGHFGLSFLPDDAVNPALPENGILKGHKISFKTNKSLSRQEAWDVFIRLLDISGLTLVPGPTTDVYRITSVTAANKDALPLYMGTDPEKLPDNAEKIRYVYFVKNSALATIQGIISSLVSTTAKVNSFADLDAIIITDKSINIKSLMKIIQEFDESPPEAMSIIKLRTTDATTVAKLYQDLTATQATGANRYFAQKKQPQSMYFPADARIIPETRTNSLILIGRKVAIQKIEEFILKHIDVTLDVPYSPLHIYSLQYTSAEKITNILQQVVVFGQGTVAQQGGVIDGQEYFDRDVKIIPEPIGNNLIIKADDDDYKKLEQIIKQLDVLQPQVAIEIMIVDISANNTKALNAQLRNKSDGSIIKNINAQSAHIEAVVKKTASLLGDLVSLATGSAGTTSLTIGNATDGIWGVFNAVNTYADTKVLSNPFLLTTNNYAASFTFGATKQVATSKVGGFDSFSPVEAKLTITITPQINVNEEISMDISIDITEFTGVTAGAGAGNTTTKKIITSANIKNGGVLALGGITKNIISKTSSKTPILGDIPIIGHLFKNTTKTYNRSNLLIFISPRIITANSAEESIDFYTQRKSEMIREMSTDGTAHTKQDPIDKGFFQDSKDKFTGSIDAFMDRESFSDGYTKTQKKVLSNLKKEQKAKKANNKPPQKKLRSKRTAKRRKKS